MESDPQFYNFHILRNSRQFASGCSLSAMENKSKDKSQLHSKFLTIIQISELQTPEFEGDYNKGERETQRRERDERGGERETREGETREREREGREESMAKILISTLNYLDKITI